jgi:hypothetical protein
MGGFKKKLPWQEQYAQNIYGAYVAANDPGDITALKLQIPTALHNVYHDKMTLQRELISFSALASIADEESGLRPVLSAYGNLIVQKMAERGLQMSWDELANAAFDDGEAMIADPIEWAQRWLAEFNTGPNGNFRAWVFADHCVRLFNADRQGLEKTRPRFQR